MICIYHDQLKPSNQYINRTISILIDFVKSNLFLRKIQTSCIRGIFM